MDRLTKSITLLLMAFIFAITSKKEDHITQEIFIGFSLLCLLTSIIILPESFKNKKP